MKYTPAIHHIREMGHAPICLDPISRRLLTPTELRDCCIFLLGYNSISGILDPTSNWDEFIECVRDSMDESYGMEDIIDIRRLNEMYQRLQQRRKKIKFRQLIGL